jgi:hypothetical protein
MKIFNVKDTGAQSYSELNFKEFCVFVPSRLCVKLVL